MFEQNDRVDTEAAARVSAEMHSLGSICYNNIIAENQEKITRKV